MLNIYGKKKKVWVTSFAEVWIEISARAVSQRRRAGHFLRGSVDWNARDPDALLDLIGHFLRGSVDWNRICTGGNLTGCWSLPSRKCGLKCPPNHLIKTSHRHFLRGSVDWNPDRKGDIGFPGMSLPSRKCGLKLFPGIKSGCFLGHFLRGSVDWNYQVYHLLLLLQVTSFAEVWIEITSLVSGITSIAVTSFAEVWIEIVVTNPIKGLVIVTSFAEVWIEMSDLMGHLIRH